MFKIYKESLGGKIVLSVIIILFIVLGAVSYLNISYISRLNKLQLEEHADLIGHTMTESLMSLMELAEQEMLQRNVMEIGQDISKLSVIDWNGVIRKSSDTSSIGKPFKLPNFNIRNALAGKKISGMSLNTKDKKIFTTLIPVQGKKICYKCHDKKLTYIGVIQVDLDQKLGFLRIQSLRNFNVIVSFIGLFLIALILLMILHKLLFNPLNKVIISASNLASPGGDLSQKIRVTSRDEIGILGSAFNKMTENLQKTMISKEYVENIIEKMSEALFVLDSDLKIFMANNAAIRLTGYSLKDLNGMPIRTILAEETYLEFSKQFKINSQRELIGLDTYCFTKDGFKIPVIFNYSVVHDKNDSGIRIICNIKDISDRKKTEKEVNDAYEKLKELQSHLVQAEKMAAIGQLAGGVAHEINNPLTGVLNNVQLIKMITLNSGEIKVGEFKELLDVIEESALRCKKITDSLLDFSHASTETFSDISLNMIIEKVMGLIEVEIKLQNILLTRNLKADLPFIKGDSQLLQQVVVGLITNAKWAIDQKFQKNQGGVITINTEYVPDTGLLQLSVIDNGLGISASQMKKIFEPFFTTKPVGQGTGLGLTVIYNIVKQHKGHIAVTSKENEGTTFQISFPVVIIK